MKKTIVQLTKFQPTVLHCCMYIYGPYRESRYYILLACIFCFSPSVLGGFVVWLQPFYWTAMLILLFQTHECYYIFQMQTAKIQMTPHPFLVSSLFFLQLGIYVLIQFSAFSLRQTSAKLAIILNWYGIHLFIISHQVAQVLGSRYHSRQYIKLVS